MSKGKIVLQDEGLLSVCEAYRISSDIAHKSWQRHWDNEPTGRDTYNLIPVVGTKVTFSKVRHVDIAYCRMLLNDTMLMKDSFRSGTLDTALCQCGKAEESVEHFLFHCEYYEKDRKAISILHYRLNYIIGDDAYYNIGGITLTVMTPITLSVTVLLH